jgi:hypothetical protein
MEKWFSIRLNGAFVGISVPVIMNSCVPVLFGYVPCRNHRSLFVKTSQDGYAPTEDGAIETTWDLPFLVVST